MCELLEENLGSFGIRKIIDCKVGADGKRIYKVKWEATWETEDQLSGCQLLIDQFWSSLSRSRNAEHIARKQGKPRQVVAPIADDLGAEVDRFQLNGNAKTEMLGVIKKTLDSPSEPLLMSPSKLLGQTVRSNTMQNELQMQSLKAELGETPTKSTPKSGNSSQNFSLLETFDNPYVKIVLVCKICNKEQHIKRPGDWKKHYFTHASNDEKPHKCEICGKGFARPVQLKNHMQKHMKLEESFTAE